MSCTEIRAGNCETENFSLFLKNDAALGVRAMLWPHKGAKSEVAEWEKRVLFILLPSPGPLLSRFYSCCPGASASTDSPFAHLVWVGSLSTAITAPVIPGNPDTCPLDLNLGFLLLNQAAPESYVLVKNQNHTSLDLFSLSCAFLHNLLNNLKKCKSIMWSSVLHELVYICIWAWHSLYTWNSSVGQANFKTLVLNKVTFILRWTIQDHLTHMDTTYHLLLYRREWLLSSIINSVWKSEYTNM